MKVEVGSYVRHHFLHEKDGLTFKDGIVVDIFKRAITEYKILFYVDESSDYFTLTQIEEEFEVLS
jgi:hypothetical protein